MYAMILVLVTRGKTWSMDLTKIHGADINSNLSILVNVVLWNIMLEIVSKYIHGGAF